MQVLSRGAVRMEQLAYGDQVLSVDRASGKPVFREVYLFGHREHELVQDYVNLKTAAGHALQVSQGMTELRWLIDVSTHPKNKCMLLVANACLTRCLNHPPPNRSHLNTPPQPPTCWLMPAAVAHALHPRLYLRLRCGERGACL